MQAGSDVKMSLLLLLAMMQPVFAEEIRSWVDKDGVVHFGDKTTAPKSSAPVELQQGTFLKLEKVAPSAPVKPAEPSVAAKPARTCTPVIQEVVDPKTGMHSQKETGRCEEDGAVVQDYGYPYYDWGPSYPRPPYPHPRPPQPDPEPPRPLPKPIGPGGNSLIPW